MMKKRSSKIESVKLKQLHLIYKRIVFNVVLVKRTTKSKSWVTTLIVVFDLSSFERHHSEIVCEQLLGNILDTYYILYTNHPTIYRGTLQCAYLCWWARSRWWTGAATRCLGSEGGSPQNF